MTENVKNIKLYLLQKIYKDLSLYILNLNTHISFLHDNYFIEYTYKQKLLNKLNRMNKNINMCYNNFIVENLDKNTAIDIWFKQFDFNNKNINIKDIIDFSKFIKLKNMPLSKQLSEIGQIISSLGYSSIDGLLVFFIGNNYKTLLDKSIISLINEINIIFYEEHLFVPEEQYVK